MTGEFLKSISIVVYEAICCNIFLGIFLKARLKSKFGQILSVMLLAGIFLIMAVFTISKWLYSIRVIGAILCIFIFSLVFYIGKWQMKLFFCGAFCAILYCVDYFLIILLNMIFKQDYLSDDVVEVIVILLCKTVLFIVVIGIEHIWKKQKLKMEAPEWILMLCYPLMSVVILFVMLFSFFGKNNSAGYMMVSFGVMVMNVVMFEWLKHISERNEKWGRIQLLQERNEERMQIYQEISADYEEQKRIIHDYKNQMNCIQGLLSRNNYEEAKTYAEKLVDVLQYKFENVDVHNPILNVVLNQKYRLAKMKGVSIIFYANNLFDLWLDEQDIVSLLSNLLDNAIEACEKLSKEKIVYLKLERERREFVISVRNPVDKPIRVEDNQIVTSKVDSKRHGIGLKNVKMILEKYQGMGKARYESGYFYYTAVLPEPDE